MHMPATPKLFCEASFKNEALKVKNEAFLRDFLQKSNFEDQKRSISASLPSKIKLSSSKTKLFCETSFKNEALKVKNTAFLRDFLQKGHVDQTLDLRITIHFSDFKWMLQKYCACHETVDPWHEICDPSTDSASEASNTDITEHEIPAPATRKAWFRTLFKSQDGLIGSMAGTGPIDSLIAMLQHPTWHRQHIWCWCPWSGVQHGTGAINSCACHVFCNASKSLRLPREKRFELPKVLRAPGV